MTMRIAVAVAVTLTAAVSGAPLHVGSGRTYADLRAASLAAQPGDTILLHAGTYTGGQWIENLKGTAGAWITVTSAPGETAVFNGGTEAVHFVDPAYVRVRGLVFQAQTGNGVNCDDGGTYATPAVHVVFDSCTWRDMNATGNNDQLKLSGVDSFEVRNCTFINGSDGGSGIDMVGCHNGVFTRNRFENQGSNSIQAKGGSQHIRIERNLFDNGGERALNLGGSTGLEFFRPIDATFEAADLLVTSNVFVDCYAPIAYVGCVRVDVTYNTIVRPQHWVIRILQETVDASRFAPCGNSSFRDNIVYLGNSLPTECNVGGNTAPLTFVFARNLWYNYESSAWSGPSDLPVADAQSIVGRNPLFVDVAAGDYHLRAGSPAIDSGMGTAAQDYDGRTRDAHPDIGAFEYVSSTVVPAIGPPAANPAPRASGRFTVDGRSAPRAAASAGRPGGVRAVRSSTGAELWIAPVP